MSASSPVFEHARASLSRKANALKRFSRHRAQHSNVDAASAHLALTPRSLRDITRNLKNHLRDHSHLGTLSPYDVPHITARVPY